MEFSKALDKLGDTALTRDDEEDDIGAAFQKFAVVTKELSALMKNMVSFFMIWIGCGYLFIYFYAKLMQHAVGLQLFIIIQFLGVLLGIPALVELSS